MLSRISLSLWINSNSIWSFISFDFYILKKKVIKYRDNREGEIDRRYKLAKVANKLNLY